MQEYTNLHMGNPRGSKATPGAPPGVFVKYPAEKQSNVSLPVSLKTMAGKK
jgi:hypothetical protein